MFAANAKNIAAVIYSTFRATSIFKFFNNFA